MSTGLSLGVTHEMLGDEYLPRAIDRSQALDDITEHLSEGSETLVMIAAHAPEAIPTDVELETLLQRVKDTVLMYMTNHADPKLVAENPLDGVPEVGLEDYRKVLTAIKDRVLAALRWIGKQLITTYKRVSDRLGRLSLRLMYLERKVDSSGDNAIPTDTMALPPSAALLSLLGKPPQNASEVMNAVNKVKWVFTTIHNDYNLYQQTFKRAIDAGDRASVLDIIKGFLSHLCSRLNTRSDPQRNGHQVFNALPSNYIVEISTGDSFTDSWATINRIAAFSVVGEESRRPDRASLSRLILELKNFLKIINELYGKVGSRLSTDFRNMTRDAERSLSSEGVDGRTVEATVNWFTEQQNRLFYRSMVLGCSVIAAAMDYCEVAMRRPSAGTEGLDDVETVTTNLTSHVAQMDSFFAAGTESLDRALVGLQILSASLEAFEPDVSVSKLMDIDLAPLRLPMDPLTYNHNVLYNNNLADYPSDLLTVLRNAGRELDDFGDYQLPQVRKFIEMGRHVAAAEKVMNREDYLGGAGYVQYLLIGSASPANCTAVVEGAGISVDSFDKLFAAFRKRTGMVAETLDNHDILVSDLYRVLSPALDEDMSMSSFTAGWSVRRIARASAYGPATAYVASLGSAGIYTGEVPVCDAGACVELQELLIRLTSMDNAFAEHWGAINRLAQRARAVQNILADSMASANQGRADEWLADGVSYLQLLLGEVRWQHRLLRDMLMYRQGLALSIEIYQRQGGF